MEQWQEQGFTSEEEWCEWERHLAQGEQEWEQRAEFIMSYVAGGGLSSEAQLAWFHHNHSCGE
jgi:hypothetical protein